MADRGDLTEGSVAAGLARLALPMVVGIIAVLSINLADTYYVGRLGTEPLAALSFTFPVALTINSLAIGLGAGAASIVSRAIGSRNRDDAKRFTTDSLMLGMVLVIVLSVVGFLTVRPLFALLGADGEVLDLIVAYMRIWYASMPFLVVPMLANSIIRAAGDATWPSAIMVASALINVAITPIFVFGWGPVPALNIEGAAWGTFVARVVTLALALAVLIFREKLVALSLPSPSELASSWRRVMRIGVPAALGNASNPIGIAVVTPIIAGFGNDAVAGFGVATRIESFAAIPMLALSASIGPMAGQNWGRGRPARVRRALKISYGVCVFWAAVLAAVFWLWATPVAGIFTDGEEVVDVAQSYLWIVPVSLFGYGITIVAAGAYNALGKPLFALGYYATRVAALYVPLSWAAALLAGQREVFIAIAVSNAVAGLVVGYLSLRWLRRHEEEARAEED